MNEMSLERLRGILDAYGANRHRWPEDERDLAEALIERNPLAQKMLESASDMDSMLDALSGYEASADLKESILSSARQAIPALASDVRDQSATRGRAGQPVWGRLNSLIDAGKDLLRLDDLGYKPASVLAASLVLGVLLGTFSTGSSDFIETDQESWAMADLTDDEVIALAFGETDYGI